MPMPTTWFFLYGGKGTKMLHENNSDANPPILTSIFILPPKKRKLMDLYNSYTCRKKENLKNKSRNRSLCAVCWRHNIFNSIKRWIVCQTAVQPPPTTTTKKNEEDQYWLLKTSISKKGLFCRVVVSPAVCTGWSILEEGTLWIIWAAQPRRQPPLNITRSDFQCWTFFFISFLPFFFFSFILKANPPEMVVSQVHIFFFFFLLSLLLLLFLFPHTWHIEETCRAERPAESLKISNTPSSTYTIADVFNRGGSGGITKL